ncbi:unnamed protein product [Pseudo-nitzschia multistriata]|uniref:Uncharacterized protein n=1 Tax=Pseudo-nitzschia multistriata TaxID=183589 RepID=A0A448Z742_9STRA|nr:unnamed protein product [Pseudo-nitzschia multistriata]
MIKDILKGYHSNLPEFVQDIFDEDKVWILNSGDRSFDDLFADCRSLTFEDFYSIVTEGVVFVTPDTAISGSSDTPSHHQYTIDMTFIFSTTTCNDIKRILHISGVDAKSTSPSLNFLLRLVLESHSKDEFTSKSSNVGVILKCFPMTPRQQLGSLDLSPPKGRTNLKRKVSSLGQSACYETESRIDLEFRFLALNKAHCESIFCGNSSVVSCVKFSQCEIDGWKIHNEKVKEKDPNGTILSTDRGAMPKKLLLSCTQSEFRKFAEGKLLMFNKTTIRELHLVLHFMMEDLDVHHLISTLETNQSLEHLSIEYLEMDDEVWAGVCKVLHNHPKLSCLQLAYTEKFADNYRRLDSERRRTRTKDVLELLKKNRNLQKIQWPKFQQDETLIADVERLLIENKKRAAESTCYLEITR